MNHTLRKNADYSAFFYCMELTLQIENYRIVCRDKKEGSILWSEL